jgi:hypothetical protein
MLFQQLFPIAKKQSLQADYKLKELQVEIGRSRVLRKSGLIIYHRKLFYNIKKEHHHLKEIHPIKSHKFVCNCDQDEHFLVEPDNFYFVYFNNKLNKCAIFTYNDLLVSELKQKKSGEFFYNVIVDKLYTLTELQEILNDKIDYKMFSLKDEDCGIINRNEAKKLRKTGKKKEEEYIEPIY